MKRILILFFFFALAACTLPAVSDFPAQQFPITPTASYAPCAYVEGRKDSSKLSALLTEKLKAAGLSLETARAEAYGENCVAADFTVVSFSQREIDFYVTLHVEDLNDKTNLGNLLEKILISIDQLPPDQMGPSPGYVGVKFQSGAQVDDLWFMLADADALLSKAQRAQHCIHRLQEDPKPAGNCNFYFLPKD